LWVKLFMGFFYDLCSATETKVPARAKALVPTNLSIAIPEGTYALVGNLSLSFVLFKC